jgi:hypothetical protein
MVAIVFMVAGMSSRFGGNPKQFAQVGPNNETLIEYSVHQALTQPFSAIYFICNPRTEIEFRKKFGNIYQGRQVHYIYQNYDTIKRKKPWGTIDAIAQLYHQTKSNNNKKDKEAYIIINGDDIYGQETFKNGYNRFTQISTTNTSNTPHTTNFIGTIPLSKTIPKEGKVNRGVIWTSEETNLVTKMEEMMNISSETLSDEYKDMYANVNFIGLQPTTLKNIYEAVEYFKMNQIGKPDSDTIECLLPDIFTSLIENNDLKLEILQITNPIYGITNPEDEETLRKTLATL